MNKWVVFVLSALAVIGTAFAASTVSKDDIEITAIYIDPTGQVTARYIRKVELDSKFEFKRDDYIVFETPLAQQIMDAAIASIEGKEEKVKDK